MAILVSALFRFRVRSPYVTDGQTDRLAMPVMRLIRIVAYRECQFQRERKGDMSRI